MRIAETADATRGPLYEARLCFLSGQTGRAKQLLIPLLQNEGSAEIITLYLACCETLQDAGIVTTLLGDALARFWKESRSLRRDMPEPPSDSGSYRNRIWDLGAEPVDNVAFNQMGAVTKEMRRAFADRKR